MVFIDNTIFLCVHCGERYKGRYCIRCKTKAGRDEIDKQNEEIKKERLCKASMK